jgi:hypothetical protein
MKKKLLIAFLVVTFLMLTIVPPAANAHWRGGPGGICILGALAALFGFAVARSTEPPPVVVQPPMCSETIPGGPCHEVIDRFGNPHMYCPPNIVRTFPCP